MKRELPRSVFVNHGAYYLVRAEGPKRVWIRLCSVKDGLPAMYLALAHLSAKVEQPESMPALIAEWQTEVLPGYAEQTRKTEQARCKLIAASFVEFTAEQVTPPNVSAFLKQFKKKPRTHNAYRALMRELMRYAEERGYRKAGTNPVTALRMMATPGRTRYITDSELRRIKVAGMYGEDGRRTRSGPMLCALIDMAHLTGQRIGDLLKLEWSAVSDEGIAFVQAKTGAKVTVESTPRLADVVERLKALRKQRRGFAPQVFTTQEGQRYTYWGASTAWRRAVKRAGVRDVHFHDIRRKAGTEAEASQGMGGARRLLGHTTEDQTSAYVAKGKGSKAKATR